MAIYPYIYILLYIHYNWNCTHEYPTIFDKHGTFHRLILLWRDHQRKLRPWRKSSGWKWLVTGSKCLGTITIHYSRYVQFHQFLAAWIIWIISNLHSTWFHQIKSSLSMLFGPQWPIPFPPCDPSGRSLGKCSVGFTKQMLPAMVPAWHIWAMDPADPEEIWGFIKQNWVV